MRRRASFALTILSLTCAVVATARAGDPDDTVHRVPGGARPGREVARPASPSWCGEITAPGWGRGAMQRTVSQIVEQGRLYQTAKGTQLLCDHPDRPAWREQTAELVQAWVNETGLSVKDATASIAARASEARWENELQFGDGKVRKGTPVALHDSPAHKKLVALYGVAL